MSNLPPHATQHLLTNRTPKVLHLAGQASVTLAEVPAPTTKDAVLIATMIRLVQLFIETLTVFDAPESLFAPLQGALPQLQTEPRGVVLVQHLTVIADHLAHAEAWLLAVQG